jgi:TatD DNase family protein
VLIVDAHVHCAELGDLSLFLKGDITAACVSDDPSSAERIIHLAETSNYIVPCVGIHPWVVHEYELREAIDLVEKAVTRHGINCLGEIGLDKRFKAETFEKQREFFKIFTKFGREYDLVLNLHAAGAWREVFDIVYGSDISRAYFHWYTGPLDLLQEITSIGYYIGVNPAVEVQEKHKDVVEYVDLKYIITESDAPYEYRGLKLTPELVKKLIHYIGELKSVDVLLVENTVYSNFNKLFRPRITH